ncbi:hypothetical protein Gpo141_00005323 [Globisporangium polare]
MSKQRRSQQQQAATLSAASLETALAQSAAPLAALEKQSGAVAVRGWEWVLTTLAYPVESDKRCAVGIVDSVLLPSSSSSSEPSISKTSASSRKAGKNVLWFVTHKNGTIVRKKAKQAAAFPAAEISERFVRLASRWGALGGSSEYIAVLVFQDGSRQLLEPAEFQEWLDALEASGGAGDHSVSSPVSSLLKAMRKDPAVARVAGLQAYIPSSQSIATQQSFITVTYTASSSTTAGSSQIDISCREAYLSGRDSNPRSSKSGNNPSISSRLRKEAEHATHTIVDFLQRASGERVQSVALEFVVDVEQKLWFTFAEHVGVAARHDKKNRVEGDPASSEQQSTCVLGARKQSLPTLPATTIGSSSSDVGGAKCRGEFCRVPPSSLPGLYSCSQSGSEDDNGNNSHEDNGGGENATTTMMFDSTAIPDTGQRFKIGNNNVQLAHAEMHFILGKVTGDGGGVESKSEVALRWQEADNVLRMELGRSNPTQFYKQVPVCPNCHRIYSELNRVRDNGFRKPGDETPRGIKHSRSAAAINAKPSKVLSSASELAKSSSADPSGEFYDQLFLAELAKHDELNSSSGDVEALKSQHVLALSTDDRSQPRPELEDPSMRPQSSNSSRSERSSLPSLSSTPSAASVKTKKKTHGVLSQAPAGLGLLTTSTRSNSSNNQLTGLVSAGDDDELRSLPSLRTHVAKLEEELAHTRGKLSLSESQKHQVEKKLLQTQSQCTAMLGEKDDQVRKQLLEMELACNSKQSLHNQRGQGSSSAASSADEMAKLIDTIDSLSFQIDQINSQKDHEKNQLTQSHQLEMKRLHEKYQHDMETLRLSEHGAKEQVEAIQLQMLNLQNQAQVATTQARNAKCALEDLAKNTLASLEEKNRRLERQLVELKAAQQQVKSGVGVAGASSISRAPTSSAQDLEALEKHMSNKIDYLKAQLASEMKCKEELGNHLAQITGSMEQTKKEKRQALLDQEETFKRQIQRLEDNFAQEKDVVASQQASLQGKMATLQANVTDLVQELTMWKSKEANARLAMEKMVEENVRVTRQIVDLEGQVEALMEERKHDGGNSSMSVKNASDETQRMQMEALLRRLDNERQYLKNQLENEQEMKEKSQRQVTTLQSEVDQLKYQLEQAAKESEMKLSAISAEKFSAERQFQESIECLEESKLLLARQFKEVQTKFAQAREQSLVDRDELEKTRIDTNEMRSQLTATKEELAKEKEYGKNASERGSKSLRLVKNSLKAMEEEKNLRIRRLEEENSMFMTKLANTQAEMLVREEKWAADKTHIKKQHALTLLAFLLKEKLTKHCLKLEMQSFHHLFLNSSVQRLRSSLEAKHSVEVDELEERLSKDFMEKCDQMTQSLHEERIDTIRQMKERQDKDREELYLYYEQEKSQLLEEIAFAHSQRLQELEQSHQASCKALQEQASQATNEMETKCALLQKERDSVTEAFAETQKRCEQLSSKLNDQTAEASREMEARALLWRTEKEETQSTHEQQLAEAEASTMKRVEELQRLHRSQIQEAEEVHVREQASRIEHAVGEVRALALEEKRALTLAHKQQLADADIQHKSRLEEEVEQLSSRWQAELRSERELSEKKLKDALERVESKAQAHLDALQKGMNDRKGHAIVQCTSKWQKALEELQERLEVEKKVAYESGLQDRENEWQQAALQIKQKQREELESVQKEALRAIQAAEERHKMQFQAKFAQLTQEFEEKRETEMLRLSAEITEREQQTARVAYEAQWMEMEQQVELKHAQELENLKDDHQLKQEQEVEKLSMAFEKEKQELLERFEAIKEKEMVELEKEWTEKLEQLSHQKDTHAQQALEELRSELSGDYEHDTQQLRDALQDEMDVRLKELEARLLNEQDEAIAQVQEDSEKLIEKVELAMTQLKTQKDVMEKELVKLRSALEEAEDSHFDVEEQMKKQRKQMTFHFLTLLMHARKRIDDDKHAHVSTVMELQEKHDLLENDRAREKRHWHDELTQIRATWSQVQGKHDEMLKTLTNYKRDELVAHRSASGVLSNEISIVTKQMDEVSEMKAALEKEIEHLQGEAQQVEASLRQLMVQNSSESTSNSNSSGTSGGSLNMAVVAKKRRLNEEFEALLEQMERKKAEVRNVEKTFAALRLRREAKEQEMRAMERKLVEILVQQQKHMLALLTAIRELAVLTPLTASA